MLSWLLSTETGQERFPCLAHGTQTATSLNREPYYTFVKEISSKPRLLRVILYLTNIFSYSWDDSDSIQTTPYPLRVEQLVFRHHEVYITYNTFRKLTQRDPDVQIHTITDEPFDRESWGLDPATGESLVNCDSNVVLGGHSFGGCTVVGLSTVMH